MKPKTMRHQYEWVLFDLSGVLTELALRDNDPIHVRDVTIIPAKLESIYYTPQFRAYMYGATSHAEVVAHFLNQQNIGITVDEFSQVFKQTLRIMPNIEAILKKLHQSYRLAVLTNEGIEWANWKMAATQVEYLFEKVIISAEINKAKPHEDFYLESLRQLNTEAKKCIFIDDGSVNVEAAEKLGMTGIVFTDSQNLEKQLAVLGVV
jgi:HAD superfamily hydrolase (TIGR01509 family)